MKIGSTRSGKNEGHNGTPEKRERMPEIASFTQGFLHRLQHGDVTTGYFFALVDQATTCAHLRIFIRHLSLHTFSKDVLRLRIFLQLPSFCTVPIHDKEYGIDWDILPPKCLILDV